MTTLDAAYTDLAHAARVNALRREYGIVEELRRVDGRYLPVRIAFCLADGERVGEALTWADADALIVATCEQRAREVQP